MHESHVNARTLFGAAADDYQKRADGLRWNFSSLIFQRRIAIVDQILDRIPAGGRVLDFGMGPAVFGPRCVDRNLKYLGIDISPVMVERAEALGLPDSEFQVGDLNSLESFHGSMDAVLAIGLIDYLEYPGEGIAQLASCVKPGGHIVLSFRNRRSVPRMLRDSAKNITKAMPRRSRSDNNTGAVFWADVHEHAFDAMRDLKPLLQDLNFAEFDVDYFNCSPFFFNFPLPRMLWKTWYAADTGLCGTWSNGMCSGGVLVAQRCAVATADNQSTPETCVA